jgi:hypothetical protein
MGWLKKTFKKGVTFNKNVFGGGYIKDALGMGKSGGKGPGDGGQEAAIREGYGAALSQNAQILGSLPKAYDKARGNLASGKAVASKALQDRGAQETANADQSMVNRGLYNTTVFDNARAGVAANVSQAQSEINAQYAQMEAELGLRQNAAENQVRSNSAQLNVGLGGALAGQKNFQSAQQQQWELSQNPDAWLDSIFGIAGTAIGYGIGNGGFGGGSKKKPPTGTISSDWGGQ